MYNIAGDLLDALRATRDTLEGLLAGVSQERASRARGGDENWNVVEVLCHLRDAEERAVERMRMMRDEDAPFLAAYDQDAWAVERSYAAEQLEDALAGFLRRREEHIADLAALAAEDWERSGLHEEQGQITISAHTLHIVAHDAIHAAQIARQLRG